MKAWLCRVAAWFKARWQYVAVGLAVVAAVAFGAKSLRERNEAKLDEKNRRAVESAREQLAAQREVRAELAGRIDARQEEIELINAHMATTRREIVQAYDATEGMTDEEVLARFKSLGYD